MSYPYDQDTPIAILQAQAEAGDTYAQWSLAKRYHEGDTTAKDMQQAVKWYHFAADAGHAVAQNNLACCYLSGEGVAADIHHGLELLHQSASKGCVLAQCNLGMHYFLGEDVKQDLLQAQQWFTLAAEQNHPQACFMLGVYADKSGDTELARAYWQSAAENHPDFIDTDLCLGAVAYQSSNYSKAIKHWESSARAGNVDAQWSLVNIHARGGVAENKHQWLAWCRIAFSQGQDLLSIAMDSSRGALTEDQVEAITFLAESGNAKFAYILGILCWSGDSVLLDRERAMDWYQRGAELGDPPSQFKVGLEYYFGKFLSSDHERANHLIYASAKQGFKLAEDFAAICYESKGDKTVQTAFEKYQAQIYDSDLDAEGTWGDFCWEYWEYL